MSPSLIGYLWGIAWASGVWLTIYLVIVRPRAEARDRSRRFDLDLQRSKCDTLAKVCVGHVRQLDRYEEIICDLRARASAPSDPGVNRKSTTDSRQSVKGGAP